MGIQKIKKQILIMIKLFKNRLLIHLIAIKINKIKKKMYLNL